MDQLIDKIWDIVKIGAGNICAKDTDICFGESKKEIVQGTLKLGIREL